MTVQQQTIYNAYTGNGVTTVFPYQFKILAAADLSVYVAGAAKVLNVDYTVSGVGMDVGGSVTFTVAPAAAAAVAIVRTMKRQRLTDYQLAGDFNTPTVNPDFDNAILLIQDLAAQLGRAITTPPDEVATLPTLPSKAARAGKYIAFDVNGLPVASIGTGNDTALRTDLASGVLANDGARLVGYRYPAAGAVARSVAAVLAGFGIQVMDYGAVGDGVADDFAAIQGAINFAGSVVATPGIPVLLPYGTYKTSAPIVFPPQAGPIAFLAHKGAVINAAHNGDGLVVISDNENYGGHIIEGLTINGPNTFLPGGGYVPPSTGAGINMNRNATTNAVTAYNSVLRDVTVQGFKYGLNLQAVIGLNVFGSYIQYNQYGVYVDGGQTNANHWFGTHIRYNRKAAVYSTGRTGGALSNATANVFHACLLESNIPYPFAVGGTPPGDSVAIYLNNSYDWAFRDCYSENHAASIYLTGASKFNKFEMRTAPGTGRIEQIILDGAGIYENDFNIKNESQNLTDVSVVSNHADQLWNTFSGIGLNFIAASILAPLDFSNVKPAIGFANTTGTGLIRMPTHGFIGNVGPGNAPGQINGIGTGAATLNAKGYGEIRMGNGITGATTITSITGLVPGQLFMLTNGQAAFNVVLQSTALNGNLVLLGGHNVTLDVAGKSIMFYVNGAGNLYEVGRNFDAPGAAYVVNNGSADRSLNVTGDTLAQGLAVLGTLIGDLQTKGIIS